MSSRTIAIRITLENRDAVRGMQEQTRATKEAGVVTDRLTHLQAGLTNSFIKGNLAARAISSAYLALRDSLFFAVGGALEFQLVMAKTQAVTGASGSELGSLKDTIFDLARANSVAVKDISAAALELAKLGFEGQTLKNSLEGVVQLSAILGDSLEATGRLVGGIANTFGLTATQVETVAEKLFVATGKSAADIEGFGVAFNFAGAAAAEAGVTFEQLSALIAILSNRGLRMSTIGTGLRTFFINMSNEGSKAAKALGGGLEAGGLIDVLDRMAKLKPDNASLFSLFGKPGLPVAANLAKIKDEFIDFTAEISRNNGELKKGSELINETVIGSVTRLKNAIIELATAFDSKPIAKFFNLITSKLNEVSDEFRRSAEFERFTESLKAKGVNPLDILAKGPKGLPVEAFDPIFRGLLEARKEAQKEQALRTNLEKDASAILDSFSPRGKIEGEEKPEKANVRRLRQKIVDQFLFLEDRLKGPDPSVKETGVDLGKLEMPEGQAFLKFGEKVNKLLEKEKNLRLEIAEILSEMTTRQAMLNQSVNIGVDALNGFAQGFSERLVDSVAGARNAFEDFGEFVGNLFKRLIAEAIAFLIKMVVIKLVTSALTGGGAGGISMVTGMAGGAVPTASGTDRFVDRPTLFMAGESGRERVTVTPRAKAASGGSGASLTVNIQGDVLDGKKFTEAVKMAEKRLKRTVF